MTQVVLTQEEFDRLTRNDRILQALYAGGVDNWEWYGDAMQVIWDEEE